MATPLVFLFQGEKSACSLSKVDRSKLYGYVEKEVLDEEGDSCRLATLASDGETLIGSGGITLAYFDPDGHWCEKSTLQAVDMEDRPVKPVASSFKEPVELLHEATVEDYLSHHIRLVYALESEDGFSVKLLEALQGGKIYQFPFSYRGGLEPDQGFLFQGQDETIWLVLGKAAAIRMIGLSEAGAEPADVADEEQPEDEDLMDFGLL